MEFLIPINRLKTNQVIDKENLAIETCALVDGFLK